MATVEWNIFGVSGDVLRINFDDGSADPPFVQWNGATSEIEFSEDGTTTTALGEGDTSIAYTDPMRIGAMRVWSHATNDVLMWKVDADPSTDDDGTAITDPAIAAITSGTISGATITATTQTPLDNSTSAATTAYVDAGAAIAAITSGTISGATITAATQTPSDNSTSVATTAYVDAGDSAFGGHEIRDSGASYASRSGLKFLGSAVAIVDDAGGDETEVTISSTAVTMPFTKADASSDPIPLSSAAVGESLVSDTTPQLGGDLDVNGSDIVSLSNANINITPHGTGKAVLGALSVTAGHEMHISAPMRVQVDASTVWTMGWWEAGNGQWFLLVNTADVTSFVRADAEFYIPTGDIADVPFS